jgi:hypothetical protein
MSSDESDVDEARRPIFRVKKRLWRNKAFTNMLKIVDEDANTTNAYGNRRSGNPPRTRLRRQGNASSTRDPPLNLPINFYDEVWYTSLTNRQKRDLGAKNGVESHIVYD